MPICQHVISGNNLIVSPQSTMCLSKKVQTAESYFQSEFGKHVISVCYEYWNWELTQVILRCVTMHWLEFSLENLPPASFCYYDLASVLDLTMVMTLVAPTLPGMRGPMTEAIGPLAEVTGLRATVLAKLCRASYFERRASSSTFMLAFSVASLSTSCCSWAFCFSSSSFWVTRFTRQLAA